MPLERSRAVRVTSVTMPSPEIALEYSISTPNQLLAFYARVSNEANQANHTTGKRLIQRLISKREWSPLEMVHMEVELITTRDIGRQILRHTSLRPQEFSQRYAVVDMEPIFREYRFQDPKDRQSSLLVNPHDVTQRRLAQMWEQDQQEVWNLAMSKYNYHISQGAAKEVVRAVLPEGLTPTRMFFSGAIRHWYHYTQLRVLGSTQKEHRALAQKCWALVLEQFPDIPDHEKFAP